MTGKTDPRTNYSARSCENCDYLVHTYEIPPDAALLFDGWPVNPEEVYVCDWGTEYVECPPSEVCGRWRPQRAGYDDLGI